MRYSKWRPDTGGYDVFESAERFPLGDDLPPPRLATAYKLGVPSTEAGRLPSGPLRPVGQSATAQGSILPLDRRGLTLGGTLTASVTPLGWFLAGVLAMALVGWAWERRP